jgi:hypothetical protein
MQRTVLLLVFVVLLSAACTVGVTTRTQSLPSAEPTNAALAAQSSPLPTATLTSPLALPVATQPAPQTPNVQAESLQPTVTNAAVAPPALQCSSSFERRELREPYQRDKHTNEPRYTLSTQELDAYLDVMGIESICVPHELGAPFVRTDWNSVQMSAQTGRMLIIGFEVPYPGQGWSYGTIVYSTYDFAVGAMYDVFASPQDRDAVRNNTMPDMIEVDGVQGFVRIQPSAFSFGTRAVYKTFVFPFENHYVAVVYELGDFDFDADWEAIIQRLQAGDYPSERGMLVPAIDLLATSIQFHSPAP